MALPRFDEGSLKQEVEELTKMLRTEEVLEDLRSLLVRAGHDPHRILLAGFLENEEGFEGGVIVTPAHEIFRFERDDVADQHFSTWERIEEVSTLLPMYPALRVALEMA